VCGTNDPEMPAPDSSILASQSSAPKERQADFAWRQSEKRLGRRDWLLTKSVVGEEQPATGRRIMARATLAKV